MTRIDWKKASADESSVKRLEYGLDIPRIAATVLVARGIVSEHDAKKFLAPSTSDLEDPMSMPDMESALDRLIDAVANDEHIAVLGHDDADGITATTIVFGSLKEIGADISYYIPDSPSEGIGLTRKTVDKLKKSGVSLIVTVDCGISCKDEVGYAKSLGIDTIITDHHEPPEELPQAVAVIDAKRGDAVYGFRELAGSGVACRLMEAFAERYRKVGTPPSLDGNMGMAALGSFADRVPLQGENRIIVSHGVREVLGKRLVPFVTLRSHIWIDGESTLTEVLAKTVPIVGASRSHEGGNLGCELLLSTEEDDAEDVLADLVVDCERKREKARRALDRVMEHVPRTGTDSAKGIVLVEEHLPNKTVGFCAARLADSLHKPVVIVSLKDDKGIGEARGPKGFDLVVALAAHKDYFMGFGGHKQAAGFSIERSRVPEFKARFADYLEEHVDPSVIRQSISIDAVLKPDQMNAEAIRSLVCLEPFGEGNQRPVFLLESLGGGMIKETEGTLRLGDTALSGERFAAERPWDSLANMDMVVSPFAEGSMRVLEVIDWKMAK